jgi:formylglycine-generating enzyme required for sulfatase activity
MGENPSSFKDPNRPVESISLEQITGSEGFLEKLNAVQEIRSQGFIFDLPGKHHWEYFAFEEIKTNRDQFAQGFVNPAQAWMEDNTHKEGTEPLGCKEPNSFGMYDIFGQVWEFTTELDVAYGIYSARGCSFEKDTPLSGTHLCKPTEKLRNLGFRLIAHCTQ